MKIANNTIVSLRYTMKNEQGEVMEDIMNSAPIDYLHGSGNIMPELETAVEGMECCQSKSFRFEINHGQKFSMDVRIDNVRAASEEELKLGRVIAEKESCGPDCDCN